MKSKLIATLGLCLLLSLGSRASAQEAKFYALFVSKFTEYVKWPDVVSGQKIVIGVFGDSQVKKELANIAAIKGDIEVMQVNNAGEAVKCHLVFMPRKNEAEFENIKKAIGNRSILLVTEDDGYAEKGAGISFFLEGSKLRFKLNKLVIEAKNMKVSNSLVAMATVI